ncbi:MAG: gamma-glutamyl-gamma-aminobutyrate hydrolase family protein [Candidatus Thermoplasmatota archaeon]|nr:gamma-glutamyl-gamma-aminobutyrate hydrolase family protein [Candidatus Thalassarchaeaceae archaeon]MEC7104661.1 gamma-glutamyl-gamma-aminobutyrate hydrolase family protein [Candidatus Thermoplasmatota archaeon]GIS03250.1 MAG: gamma-glutamyl-gamma-aminobutyrate hydrolase [Euryarchaeota archaeon]MEC7364949.1 gamma-glutamyl-gamma-aminobutyrate hydrolase family protein [Candidatus Thermoplasmatota archaeon]MEC7425605.1 gamma-glutamyl-gamma-aminobutyrate hydrolase family protein [Candidatus Ther|tara:strand:+ start:11854 stop:12543 length:690 start_codon:yes stop_codon:yes gene_type:complete
MKPIIGITCCMREARYSDFVRHAAILPSAYISMVDKVGGVPMIIPPAGDMTILLDSIDGLIVSGGPDISPANYNEEPGPMTTEFYPEQDYSEMGLIERALERDMPLLGICRGMQILSVAHGGRMHQHLDTTPGHEGHGGFFGKSTEHGVVVERGSQLASIMGDSFTVNSLHHQGVSDAGSLEVSARADHDGLIEGVERKDKKFCLGVQWHPERKGHDLLFSALIQAARG